MAFGEIGISNYEFDLSPAQQSVALSRLDAMMATWNGLGLALGYKLPSEQDGSDLDEPTNIPDSATEAAYLCLAARLAPSYGKQLSQQTLANADAAYAAMVGMAVGFPKERQFPSTTPRGAGNRQRGNFVGTPVEPLETGGGDIFDFN